MARYKLKTDHYREGHGYLRAGSYIEIEKGGIPPPKGSIRVKDAVVEDEAIDDDEAIPDTDGKGADGKGAKDAKGRPNDKSPV